MPNCLKRKKRYYNKYLILLIIELGYAYFLNKLGSNATTQKYLHTKTHTHTYTYTHTQTHSRARTHLISIVHPPVPLPCILFSA